MTEPVNVLCLHGCNQTSQMFSNLLKNYIKLGEKQYNLKFHFLEAKYDHPLGGKTWYKRPLNVAEIGQIRYDKDLVQDTLEDLYFEIENKNITVLLGFSQGANVVDTFLSYKGHPGIKQAVLMSGYSLVDENRQTSLTTIMSVISDNDNIVPSHLNPNNMY